MKCNNDLYTYSEKIHEVKTKTERSNIFCCAVDIADIKTTRYCIYMTHYLTRKSVEIRFFI